MQSLPDEAGITAQTAPQFAGQPLCKQCAKPLSGDETAIYKKLINRGASEYLCIDCLAVFFGCERKIIEDQIAYYRKAGTCVLFR
ncbi:hypothetical protein FACS189461_2810 [Spirochaetia bacterium]|nr:hypothetical protein FACS189461_2810 [Spirochaetia bacterium]